MNDGSFVSPELRARIRAGALPVAAAFGAIGLSPNMLTLLGFGISAIAAMSAAVELWLLAALVSVGGAAFDLLDGALARLTGRSSVFGAFLDSTFDRWGEAVVYAGIAVGGYGASSRDTVLLAGLAMGAAFMVSYTRAKAESLGFRGEVGIAPRPERVVVLGVGLAAAGLTGGPGAGPWLQLALLLLLTISTITTLQRIKHVQRQAG
ncbi:MAG: CDP-alcohol phosphatidyltransferase family protein [Candidatus Limnocylindrales bacterium]